MILFYKNNSDKEQGIINSELVGKDVEDMAKEFFPLGDDKKPKFSSTQLRKFYNEIKRYELRWRERQEDDIEFKRILPMLKLLKAKAEYALSRKTIHSKFKEWLCENISAIQDSKDFKAFLLHFEAVVGFSAQYTRD